MRIHTENTEKFIQALAFAIIKDPASLESWQCLHIKHSEESLAENRGDIIQQIKEIHTDIDCDVIQCSDNDVLFISYSLHGAQMYAIANEFINAASVEEGGVAECALYDIFRDWEAVSNLLISKAGKQKILPAKPILHNFGEIASLEEVFLEAKKLRKARLPLHVLVVDDDPLTRCIVTGAFKDSYALITAVNAQEAVSNYLLYAPDIVFLDIGLPDASGFDVLHQIIANDSGAYVIMFSANSYLDNVTKALSSGACGFISKPFKKEKMRQYIKCSELHHRKQYA